MVVIASPAARAKERGPRRQVQRSDVVEAAVKRRQQQRARKQADSVSKARLAGEADKQSRGKGVDALKSALNRLRARISPEKERDPNRSGIERFQVQSSASKCN